MDDEFSEDGQHSSDCEWENEMERLEALVEQGQKNLSDSPYEDKATKETCELVDVLQTDTISVLSTTEDQNQDEVVILDDDIESFSSTGSRRNATAAERLTAIHVHRCTLLTLITRGIWRNSWCENKTLQAVAASTVRSQIKLPFQPTMFLKEDVASILNWFVSNFATSPLSEADGVGAEGLKSVLEARVASETDFTLILLSIFRGLGLAARLLQAVRPLHWRLKEVVVTSSGAYFVRPIPRLKSSKSFPHQPGLQRVGDSKQENDDSVTASSLTSNSKSKRKDSSSRSRSANDDASQSVLPPKRHRGEPSPLSELTRAVHEGASRAQDHALIAMAEEGTDLFLAQQLVLEAAREARAGASAGPPNRAKTREPKPEQSAAPTAAALPGGNATRGATRRGASSRGARAALGGPESATPRRVAGSPAGLAGSPAPESATPRAKQLASRAGQKVLASRAVEADSAQRAGAAKLCKGNSGPALAGEGRAGIEPVEFWIEVWVGETVHGGGGADGGGGCAADGGGGVGRWVHVDWRNWALDRTGMYDECGCGSPYVVAVDGRSFADVTRPYTKQARNRHRPPSHTQAPPPPLAMYPAGSASHERDRSQLWLLPSPPPSPIPQPAPLSPRAPGVLPLHSCPSASLGVLPLPSRCERHSFCQALSTLSFQIIFRSFFGGSCPSVYMVLPFRGSRPSV